MAKGSSDRNRLPPKLRDAAEAIVELVREGGPVDLGGGVVADIRGISQLCKCRCTINGLIDGKETIQLKKSAEWTFTLGTFGKNAACGTCEHTGTDWKSSDPTKFAITDQGKLKCTVKALDPAKEGDTFVLSATPKGTCACNKAGGGVENKECTGTDDTVTIKAVK